MSSTEKVICDGCKRDLTKTTNAIAYRLVLYDERIPSVEGPATLLNIMPSLKGSRHFCHLGCLNDWLNAL